MAQINKKDFEIITGVRIADDWDSSSIASVGSANDLISAKKPEVTNAQTLAIYGGISGVTEEEVYSFLDKAKGDITIRINSGGGSFFTGVAVYNALTDYKGGSVTTVTDGLAASAASIIFASGGIRIMNKSTQLLIHNVSSLVFGNADFLEREAKSLRALDTSLVEIYTATTNMSENEVLDLMAEDRFISAAESKKLGFATEIKQREKEENKKEENKVSKTFDLLAAQEEVRRVYLSYVKSEKA